MLMILGVVINMVGGRGGSDMLYDHLMSMKIFTLMMAKMFI